MAVLVTIAVALSIAAGLRYLGLAAGETYQGQGRAVSRLGQPRGNAEPAPAASGQEPGWLGRLARSAGDGYVQSARLVDDAFWGAWDYTTAPSRWKETAASVRDGVARDAERLAEDPLGTLWDGLVTDARVAADLWMATGKYMVDVTAAVFSGDPDRIGRHLGELSYDGLVAFGSGAAALGPRVGLGGSLARAGPSAPRGGAAATAAAWQGLDSEAVRELFALDGMSGRMSALMERFRSLDGVTGEDPLVFRGAPEPASEAFQDGLEVRAHPYAAFPEKGKALEKVYASTSTNPVVSSTFAADGRIYVLRGESSKKLYPDYKKSYEHEEEWAMPEIGGHHILGVITPTQNQTWKFTANLGYGPARPNAARGRMVAGVLAERRAAASQEKDDLDALFHQAAESRKEFEETVKRGARETGGEAVLAPLKSRQSAEAKLSGTSPSGIRDLSRARIVYDSVDDVYKGLDYFAQQGEVLNLKDRFARPFPDGYRDLQFNLRTENGHLHEVQLHYRPLLEVTETAGGHRGYEEARRIWRKAQAEDRPLTPAERRRLEQLQSESRARYDRALSQED